MIFSPGARPMMLPDQPSACFMEQQEDPPREASTMMAASRTLSDVVQHYDKHFGLKLTDREKDDLIAYLKSI